MTYFDDFNATVLIYFLLGCQGLKNINNSNWPDNILVHCKSVLCRITKSTSSHVFQFNQYNERCINLQTTKHSGSIIDALLSHSGDSVMVLTFWS